MVSTRAFRADLQMMHSSALPNSFKESVDDFKKYLDRS